MKPGDKRIRNLGPLGQLQHSMSQSATTVALVQRQRTSRVFSALLQSGYVVGPRALYESRCGSGAEGVIVRLCMALFDVGNIFKHSL